jgi:hypothetical protein
MRDQLSASEFFERSLGIVLLGLIVSARSLGISQLSDAIRTGHPVLPGYLPHTEKLAADFPVVSRIGS